MVNDDLPNGWRREIFSNVIDINSRYSIKKGLPAKFVEMKSLINNQREIADYENRNFTSGSKFKNGDTLFARITPCLENGKTAYCDILANQEIAFGSTEFLVFSEVDGKTHDKFIYYLSRHDEIRQFAVANMNGTSGRQRVPKEAFDKLEISLPPLKEQKRIAKTLSDFDDKINTNNRINFILEQIISNVFNNHFIQPDSRSIPKGWSLESLGESSISRLLNSGIKKFEGHKNYIATADVKGTKIRDMGKKITMDNRPSRANMQPLPNTLWFAKMKDSRKLLSVFDFSTELLNDYIFSTGFAGLSVKPHAISYLWQYMKSMSFDQKKNSLCNGTTMQAVNTESINSISFLVPPQDMLAEFNDFAIDKIERIYCNEEENNKLAQIRDIILPKLMSGEIRV